MAGDQMTMFRFLICAAALCGLPAHAQAAKYTIDFPLGWSAPVESDGAAVSRAPANIGDTWCRANSNPMPSLAQSTQEELNKEFADPWDAATWADVLTVAADKIQPSAGTSALVDGHLVQKVTLVFADDVFGGKVTGRFVSHVLVGRMVNAACFTRSEAYDSLKDMFEKTLLSLKPAG